MINFENFPKLFPLDPSLPFAIFTRVVDQIGGNLFNPNRESAVLGLIYELEHHPQFPDQEMTFEEFLRFLDKK